MALIKVRDKDGKFYDIPALQGPQGVPGPQGVGITQTYIQDGVLYIKYTDSEEPQRIGQVVGSTTNEQELDFFPLDDGTYGVAAGNSEYLSKIEIPETYNGKNITLITTKGFYNPYNELYDSERTKEITVSQTVTTIEPLAFHSENIWMLIRLKHTELDVIPKVWDTSFDIWESVNGELNSMSPLVIAVTDIDIYKKGEETQTSIWENFARFMVSGIGNEKLSTFSFGVKDEEGEITETIRLPFFEGQTWGEWYKCGNSLNRLNFALADWGNEDYYFTYEGKSVLYKNGETDYIVSPSEKISNKIEYYV